MDSTLVCDLTALSGEQCRRQALVLELLRPSVQELRELPDGYALRLPGETSTLLLAAELIALERLCCPFLKFGIEIESRQGPIWVQLTGPDGVKPFLVQELGLG